MPSDGRSTAAEELAWIAIRDNASLALSFIQGMTVEQFAVDRRTF